MRSLRQPRATLACALFLLASPAWTEPSAADFPDIPLPPPIEGLIGMPQVYPPGRQAYLDLVRREAELAGLPPDIADAVTQIESAYNPAAVGGVGEVGLMQIRPTTAAMLGYRGTLEGLSEPRTNVRYGVMYLAGAWQLANGDLCRALMKYRAGHGEERMTPLSVEYCRRARVHLATIGSAFGAGTAPANQIVSAPFAPTAAPRVKTTEPPSRTVAVQAPRRPSQAKAIKVAATGPVALSPVEARKLALAQEREKIRKGRIRQMWAAHNVRMQVITSKVKSATLRIATGI